MKNAEEITAEIEVMDDNKEFGDDVLKGLSLERKELSSKYFYDDEGSRIFQQIMALPEYYLTNCEFEILSKQSNAILKQTEFEGHFNIIELGAGDGVKTLELLREATQMNLEFTYIPIDISEEAVVLLEGKLKNELPNLNVAAKVGDYFKMLDEISKDSSPSLILFMGANIGNYSREDAEFLLKNIQGKMKSNDRLMIGFDLRKNPLKIAAAYFDAQGVTKAFNLNLLKRINREFGGDFDLDKFDFYSHYNPDTGEVKSYLVSLQQQEVSLSTLNASFKFAKDELIYTEQSKKYSFEEIEQLATQTGYRVDKGFTDDNTYFVDSLWIKQ